MRYLSVDKTQVPVQMLVIIEGIQYEMLFNYNVLFDFFTVSLSRDGISIVDGEKVVLNKPLFTTINVPFSYTHFIPMDLSEIEDAITFDNFGESIFLWVFSTEGGVVSSE